MQVNIATRINIDTAKALDDYAKRTGRSKASIIDAALREYLDRAQEARRKECNK